MSLMEYRPATRVDYIRAKLLTSRQGGAGSTAEQHQGAGGGERRDGRGEGGERRGGVRQEEALVGALGLRSDGLGSLAEVRRHGSVEGVELGHVGGRQVRRHHLRVEVLGVVLSLASLTLGLNSHDGSDGRLNPAKTYTRHSNIFSLSGRKRAFNYSETAEGWTILSSKYSSSPIRMARRRRLPAQAVVDDSEVQVVAVDTVLAVDSVDVTVRVSVKKKKGSRSPTWLDSIETPSGIWAKQPATPSNSKMVGAYMMKLASVWLQSISSQVLN